MMDNIIISPNKSTFGIHFNFEKGLLEFSGTSYPDNAADFFEPLCDWVKKLIANSKKTITVNFKINYFNTSSSKYIFLILELLSTYYKTNSNVVINWYFFDGEEDMLEAWKEIVDELSLPYNIIMQ